MVNFIFKQWKTNRCVHCFWKYEVMEEESELWQEEREMERRNEDFPYVYLCLDVQYIRTYMYMYTV